MNELLTVAEMTEADRLTVASGVKSLTLMERAGRTVADCVAVNYRKGKIVVLCGPGNNGGDGFVAARHLKNRTYNVQVALLGSRSALSGDAAAMAKKWRGEIFPLTRLRLDEASAGQAHAARALSPKGGEGKIPTVIIDALFGAGLSRALDGEARAAVEAVNASGLPVVAVDVPSGLSGDSGRPIGDICIHAKHTVTFFRKKPGHVLMPGRAHCGEIDVADIGIPDKVLGTIRPRTFENSPALWSYPWPRIDAHKYARGHCVAVSGPAHATGAARLAARGALRAGAGLVSVASPPDAVAVNAAHLTAIMVKPFDGAAALSALLADTRLNAVVLGPGLGVGVATQALVAAALGSGASVVLDADALTSFAEKPAALFARLHPRCVLTPHDGEFERLFPGLLKRNASKLDATREAAALAGCVVLLKGPDTVIAEPNGRAAINANAPPGLATAGAGDVLAGVIAGLLAQGMAPFEAASCAAWLHGAAATRFGFGLIAEDLPEMLPEVLRDLRERQS